MGSHVEVSVYLPAHALQRARLLSRKTGVSVSGVMVDWCQTHGETETRYMVGGRRERFTLSMPKELHERLTARAAAAAMTLSAVIIERLKGCQPAEED